MPLSHRFHMPYRLQSLDGICIRIAYTGLAAVPKVREQNSLFCRNWQWSLTSCHSWQLTSSRSCNQQYWQSGFGTVAVCRAAAAWHADVYAPTDKFCQGCGKTHSQRH
jgi:hypothetical protein